VAPALKAIFFDLDDTLFSTSLFAHRARLASVDAMVAAGLDIEPDLLLDELNEVVAEFSSNYDKHFEQLLRRIPKRIEKLVNPAIVIAAGVIAYHETKARELSPYPDAKLLLAELARQGEVIRGIISSGLTIKQAEKILRLGIYGYLSPKALFISEQIGINKPNPKLYKRACSDLNLRASECLYVGDRADRDIDPANSIGMKTVHIIRDGRHRDTKGASEPSHRISNYYELADILRSDYGLSLNLTKID